MKLVIDDDLSCTTVLLLVSIADEEGGHEEAPASPAIVIVVSNRHLYHVFFRKWIITTKNYNMKTLAIVEQKGPSVTQKTEN